MVMEEKNPSSIQGGNGKKVRESHPELEKINEFIRKLHEKELTSKRSFWSTKRRRQLHEIGIRVFFACAISGVVMIVTAAFWLRYFSSIDNVYPVLVVNKQTNSTEKAVVRTPFISDIRYAEQAFSEYIMGTLLLLEGCLFVTFGRRSNFEWRTWWYFAAILLLTVSVIFIAIAPLKPVMGMNSEKEEKELKEDEYLAYTHNNRGTISYFRRFQCDKIEEFVSGKPENTEVKGRIRFFCTMLFRLVNFFLFMWATLLIPLLAFVFSCLEVIVNKKSWDMKKLHHYKPRTPEQIADDKTRSDTKIMLKAQPELENMF